MILSAGRKFCLVPFGLLSYLAIGMAPFLNGSTVLNYHYFLVGEWTGTVDYIDYWIAAATGVVIVTDDWDFYIYIYLRADLETLPVEPTGVTLSDFSLLYPAAWLVIKVSLFCTVDDLWKLDLKRTSGFVFSCEVLPDPTDGHVIFSISTNNFN